MSLPFINESIGLPSLHMPSIGISEILDILILCALIYYILRWIRHTHAWALLKGIVMVVLVALVAYLFDLVTVIWMVQNAFAMGLISLVILFQPELRKALEQLGRGVGLSGLSGFHGLKLDHRGGIAPQSLDEIVSAVLSMASRRTGALICLERDVTLDDIAQTGILIDAVVTRQLIMNIFVDRAPLHDGAMVIRRGRIVSAACILPLTSEDVDQELGTRHRAAMGVSEISDALVIVVSEETGTISVALNGKLNRHLSEKSLNKILSENAVEEPKRRLMPWKNGKT